MPRRFFVVDDRGRVLKEVFWRPRPRRPPAKRWGPEAAFVGSALVGVGRLAGKGIAAAYRAGRNRYAEDRMRRRATQSGMPSQARVPASGIRPRPVPGGRIRRFFGL